MPLWPGDAPNLVPGGKAETFVNERYANVSVPQLFVYLPQGKRQRHGPGDLRRRRLQAPGDVPARGERRAAAERPRDRRVRPEVPDPVRQERRRGGCAWPTASGPSGSCEPGPGVGLDPQRIGVQGYSAGGNLCLNLAGRFDVAIRKRPIPSNGSAADRISAC